MENSMLSKNSHYDLLSRSYNQGIERITGQKDLINFTLPKAVLKVREKTWDNLFDKYSDVMSDEIELNVNTLEPESEFEEKFSEETHSSRPQTIMRKSPSLVQYWVNTGNLPYDTYMKNNISCESNSSLSEEEITSPSYSQHPSLCKGNMQKHRSDSSCSSVDTAAYILSNANITRKADTIAIIEGARHTNAKSSESDCTIDSETDDETRYKETVKVDNALHNDNSNVSTNISDSLASHSVSIHKSKTNCMDNSITTSANATSPNSNVSSDKLFCNETNKVKVSDVSWKNTDLQDVNSIASIFRQLDKMSKRLSNNNNNNGISNDTLDKNKTSEICSPSQKQVSGVTTEEIVDTSLKPIRKKLYTNRSSPVDLILMKKSGSNILCTEKNNLHPALAPDDTNKSSINNYKRKQQSSKKKLNLKKLNAAKRKRRKASISSDSSNKIYNIISNNVNQHSTINRDSSKDLLDSQNLNEKSDNNLLSSHNSKKTTNLINVQSKRDLSSLNLNPVVLLERIIPSLRSYDFKSVENNNIVQKSSIHDKEHLEELDLCANNTENVDLKSVGSNTSTILICECQETASQYSSSNNSVCLQFNTKYNYPISNAKKKDGKLSNLNRTAMKLVQKQPFVVLKRLSQSVINKYTDTEQVLNNEIYSSKSYKKCKENNMRIREVKVVLKRLSNTRFWKRNATNSNISSNKKILRNTTLTNVEDINTSTQVILENIYAKRTRSKSKKNNSMDDEFNIASKHTTQIHNGVELDSTIQYKTDVKQVRGKKFRKEIYSTCISSDEDDFTQMIRVSNKKLRSSTSGETLNETDTVKNNSHNETKRVNTINAKRCHNCDLSTSSSSGEANSQKIGESIMEKYQRDETKVKSFDDKTTATEDEGFSFYQNESDKGSNWTENTDNPRKINCFSNKYKSQNSSNNSTRHTTTVVKKNSLDNKHDASREIIHFKTKVYLNSSSSDKDSNDSTDNTAIYTTLRNSAAHRRSRYSDRINNSNARKHVEKQSSLLNSSLKMHDASNQTYNLRKNLRSSFDYISRTNKQTDEMFNNNLRTSNKIKDRLHSFVTSNVSVREDTTFITSSESDDDIDNSARKKLVFKKNNLRNPLISQTRNLRSSESLTFQTKNYYNSDSSEYS